MAIAAKNASVEARAEAVMPATTPSYPAESALPALTTNMAASSLTNGGNSCLDEQIERLKRCEYLREGEVKALCLRAREILVDESNVQRVDAPVTVRFVHSSSWWSWQHSILAGTEPLSCIERSSLM